jgi:hypothetical protein
MKRRAFLRTLSAGLGSAALGAGLALPASAQYGADYGVPRPPGPPKPPQAKPAMATNQPPYTRAIPSTPFDAPPGTWTLVAMPDTQSMSIAAPAELVRQTQWIVEHRERHNIRFVAHEGDVVEINFAMDQWRGAHDAMRVLTSAGVPWCVLPGNHDLGTYGLATDRFTNLNNAFSSGDYAASEAAGLFETGKMENSWHHFSAADDKYLVLALEYGPRNEVVEWSNEIVRHNPDRKAIVVTHGYLDHQSRRYDAKGPHQTYNPAWDGIAQSSSVNDGQMLWNKLIKDNPSVFLVLCGHELFNGTGYLMSVGSHGQRVHQILANYQANIEPERPYVGGAYLRLMQFRPDRSVVVKSYSPWTDTWLTSPDQRFSFMV